MAFIAILESFMARKIKPEQPSSNVEDARPPKAPPPHVMEPKQAGVDMVAFARRLDQAMMAKNLSQSELASMVWGTRESMINGKSYTVARNRDRLSVYLSGRGLPRRDSLYKMASALGLKPEQLCPEVAQSASNRLPPDVSFSMIDPVGGVPMAELRVHALVTAATALQIATLIHKERDNDRRAA